MNLDKKLHCVNFIIAISVLQLLTVFDWKWVEYISAFVALVFCVYAYSGIKAEFKKMVAAFICAGAAINFFTHQPLEVWVSGMNSMLNIVGILVFMQLFIVPIHLGNFAENLRFLILKVLHTERSIYVFAIMVIQLFSTILLFGTIPVMTALIGEPLSKVVGNYQRFMSTALTRGYASIVMWAPGAVNVLLALNATGAVWKETYLQGLFLGALGIVLAVIFQLPYLSGTKISALAAEEETFHTDTKKACWKICIIIGVVLALIVLILLFDWLQIGRDSTYRVVLSSLILASAWIAFYIGDKGLKKEILDYRNVSLPKTVDLAVMYVSLGLFSKALLASGLLKYLNPTLLSLSSGLGLFTIPFVMFVLIVLAFVGIHPFILIVLLGQLFASTGFIPLPVLAMALMFGAAISYMTSPFAGMMLTTTQFLGISLYKLGVVWNGLYCFVYFVLGSMFLMYWAILIGV